MQINRAVCGLSKTGFGDPRDNPDVWSWLFRPVKLAVLCTLCGFCLHTASPAAESSPMAIDRDRLRQLAIVYIIELTSEAFGWEINIDKLVELGLHPEDARSSLESAMGVYAECLVDGFAVLNRSTENYLIELFAEREPIADLSYSDLQQLLRDRGLELTDFQIGLLKQNRQICAVKADQAVGAPFEIL